MTSEQLNQAVDLRKKIIDARQTLDDLKSFVAKGKDSYCINFYEVGDNGDTIRDCYLTEDQFDQAIIEKVIESLSLTLEELEIEFAHL